MTAIESLDAVAHDLVVRTTQACGLPEKVEDVATLALAAEFMGANDA